MTGGDYACTEFSFAPSQLKPGAIEHIFDDAVYELKKYTRKHHEVIK